MTRPSNYAIGVTIKVPRHNKVKLKSLRRAILTVVSENETGPIVIPRGWIDGRLSASREVRLDYRHLSDEMLQVSPHAVGYTYSSYQTIRDWIVRANSISGLQLKWSEINSFVTDEDQSYYKSKLCKFYVKQGILTEKEPESKLDVLGNVINNARGIADVPY